MTHNLFSMPFNLEYVIHALDAGKRVSVGDQFATVAVRIVVILMKHRYTEPFQGYKNRPCTPATYRVSGISMCVIVPPFEPWESCRQSPAYTRHRHETIEFHHPAHLSRY